MEPPGAAALPHQGPFITAARSAPAEGHEMQLLIVDEQNPARVLRLTVTCGDGDGALVRGDLDVEELRSDQLFELLLTEPQEPTVIVRSGQLRLQARGRPLG
jgi:hypothetical protein